jgi:hypothetical protein
LIYTGQSRSRLGKMQAKNQQRGSPMNTLFAPPETIFIQQCYATMSLHWCSSRPQCWSNPSASSSTRAGVSFPRPRELISEDLVVKIVVHELWSHRVVCLDRFVLCIVGCKITFGKIVDTSDMRRWNYDHGASVGSRDHVG